MTLGDVHRRPRRSCSSPKRSSVWRPDQSSPPAKAMQKRREIGTLHRHPDARSAFDNAIARVGCQATFGKQSRRRETFKDLVVA